MYLALFNFVIKHCLGKTNPMDMPLRRPDYTSETQANTELLNYLKDRLVTIQEVDKDLMH